MYVGRSTSCVHTHAACLLDSESPPSGSVRSALGGAIPPHLRSFLSSPCYRCLAAATNECPGVDGHAIWASPQALR
jgi:hypothetical protein